MLYDVYTKMYTLMYMYTYSMRSGNPLGRVFFTCIRDAGTGFCNCRSASDCTKLQKHGARVTAGSGSFTGRLLPAYCSGDVRVSYVMLLSAMTCGPKGHHQVKSSITQANRPIPSQASTRNDTFSRAIFARLTSLLYSLSASCCDKRS